MFYTGSHFLRPEPDYANIEAVGVAVSADLETWEKRPGPVSRADARWYETYTGHADGWKEEAWRDPWVFKDPSGSGWHMLVTARSKEGPIDDRGVIGHAWSADLEHWEVRPPLSTPGSGYAHLEVPQLARVDGQWFLLFSVGRDALSSSHAAHRGDTGTWALAVDHPAGPFDVASAEPLTSSAMYAGRLVEDRAGEWQLLGFDSTPGRAFVGAVSDPVPVSVQPDGTLQVHVAAYAAT
jgi:beta-fructofuranosidase